MAFIERRNTHVGFIPSPSDVLRAANKWTRRRQKRKEIQLLLNQEDWVLKDMGITRGDVIEALSKAGDASLHLRALAARRRFWNNRKDRV